MRSIEKLIDEQKKKEKNNKTAVENEEPDELEATMQWSAAKPINSAVSMFDRNLEKNRGGINTAPSVFDKGAVFHVSGEDE